MDKLIWKAHAATRLRRKRAAQEAETARREELKTTRDKAYSRGRSDGLTDLQALLGKPLFTQTLDEMGRRLGALLANKIMERIISEIETTASVRNLLDLIGQLRNEGIKVHVNAHHGEPRVQILKSHNDPDEMVVHATTLPLWFEPPLEYNVNINKYDFILSEKARFSG